MSGDVGWLLESVLYIRQLEQALLVFYEEIGFAEARLVNDEHPEAMQLAVALHVREDHG